MIAARTAARAWRSTRRVRRTPGVPEFLQVARQSFLELQAAWDRADWRALQQLATEPLLEDLREQHVTYLSGDTWNVNPVALARVQRLFCRNERAVLRLRVGADGWPVALVPVAAILVAAIRLNFVDILLHLRYRGPNEIPCSVRLSKGDEMGYFQHGSTIIVFAPRGFALCAGIEPGRRIRMGEPLMALPAPAAPAG